MQGTVKLIPKFTSSRMRTTCNIPEDRWRRRGWCGCLPMASGFVLRWHLVLRWFNHQWWVHPHRSSLYRRVGTYALAQRFCIYFKCYSPLCEAFWRAMRPIASFNRDITLKCISMNCWRVSFWWLLSLLTPRFDLRKQDVMVNTYLKYYVKNELIIH